MTADPPLGIIGGSAFLDRVTLEGSALRHIETPYGSVAMHVAADFVFLRRHGEVGYRPPHRVPHHAHVSALAALGVRHAVGFASSGSLHTELRPGDVVIPDDYLSWHAPPTFAGDEYLHIVPQLDRSLRELLGRATARAVAGVASASAIERGGVYVETRGPRFETRAEVRLLARHARVVGMTAASEATLCQERGIAYAMLCIVDNWANGIGAEPLTLDSFQAQLAHNAATARAILHELLTLHRARSLPDSLPEPL